MLCNYNFLKFAEKCFLNKYNEFLGALTQQDTLNNEIFKPRRKARSADVKLL